MAVLVHCCINETALISGWYVSSLLAPAPPIAAVILNACNGDWALLLLTPSFLCLSLCEYSRVLVDLFAVAPRFFEHLALKC